MGNQDNTNNEIVTIIWYTDKVDNDLIWIGRIFSTGCEHEPLHPTHWGTVLDEQPLMASDFWPRSWRSQVGVSGDVLTAVAELYGQHRRVLIQTRLPRCYESRDLVELTEGGLTPYDYGYRSHQ